MLALAIRLHRGRQVTTDSVFVYPVARKVSSIRPDIAVEEARIGGTPQRAIAIAIDVGRRFNDRSQKPSGGFSPQTVVEHVAAASKQCHDDRAREADADRNQHAPP